MPSTTWTIPIDGSKKAIGPFPFKVRSITIENRCTAGNLWAVDDRGAQYEATPLTAVQSKAEDTTYLTVYIDAPQAVGSGTIIISDSEPLLDVSTSQLTSQATGSGSNVIVPTVALASFPPAAPVDGQTVYLILPAAYDPVGNKPVRWLCQYDAATAVWHVTGPPLYANVDTLQTIPAAAYGDLATVGPSLLIPRPGDYQIEAGASFDAIVAGDTQGYIAYAGAGVAAAADADAAIGQAAGANPVTASMRRFKSLIAGTLVAKYRAQIAGDAQASSRWIQVTPMRIT